MNAPPAAAPDAKPALTHGCARCGAQIPIDVGLCERCNPLGLRDSSASQVHGIAVAGVIAFVIFLAIVGRLALAGVGPFEATIAAIEPAPNGLAITLSVKNTGSGSGRTTCRVLDPADRTGSTGAFLLTPSIDAGQTVTFSQTVTELGTVPRQFTVECSAP